MHGWDDGLASQGLSTLVFVELAVSVVDSSGTPATTTLSASVPVSQGGINAWCFAQASKQLHLFQAINCCDTVVCMHCHCATDMPFGHPNPPLSTSHSIAKTAIIPC